LYPSASSPTSSPSPYGALRSTSAGLHDSLVTVSASKSEDPQIDADRALLEEAQERFRTVVSSESLWRAKAQEELNFCDALEHWDAGMREERGTRPCLTFDRIGPSIDQVVNDARQSPPEAKVSPAGGKVDDELAEIIQGLLRNIDEDSGAITAYMTAYEHACKVGRGWWRIHFEFEHDDGFEQKITVKRVPNLFSVYADPSVLEFDYSDMNWAFVTEDIDKSTFQSEHPDSLTAGSNFESINDKIRTEWYPKGAIRVAEYWWVETEETSIALLPGGKTAPADQAPAGAQTRKVKKRKVFGAKITGGEVLERWDWPGKWIPLVPCLGREYIKEGKRHYRGMIRAAMDSNRMFDYMLSREAETIGLASIVQWLVAEGQLEGLEYQWAQANRKSLPFLEYKTKDQAGQPVPAPQRIFSTPPLGGIAQAVQHMDEASKSTLATWNPSLGGPSPEASGRAITARQRESDNAHFNYHDNLVRARWHSARIIIDLIPHVYNEQRALHILNPDGSSRRIQINMPWIEKGAQVLYSFEGPLRCDVTIGTGPTYANRRAEANDKLMQLAQFLPILAARAPDLIVKAADIPEGEAIADRVRPPDVQNEQEGQPPVPPQVQQQMAQLAAQNQQLTAAVHHLSDLIERDVLKYQSAERIALQGNQARILAAEVSSKNAAAIQLAQMDHDAIRHQLDARMEDLHFQQSIEQDAAELAAQQQQQQAQPQSAA
jgi:hypothetical protein